MQSKRNQKWGHYILHETCMTEYRNDIIEIHATTNDGIKLEGNFGTATLVKNSDQSSEDYDIYGSYDDTIGRYVNDKNFEVTNDEIGLAENSKLAGNFEH